MPPIHSSVLVFAERTSGFVGSKALRFGGMKCNVPGCGLAGGALKESIVDEVVLDSCLVASQSL